MYVHCGALVYISNISLADNRHINIVTHHCNGYNDGTLHQHIKNSFHSVQYKII